MRTTDMVAVNRNLKDRVFCTLYKEKSRALELYNGINQTNYTDETQLEIVTLDDAIYMKMHNDVALLINNHLSLYEHQSTRNPNLPLRGLLYFAELYRQLTKDQHIYSSKLIKLPTPCFIVFYNGNADIGEGEVLKLSDAFHQGNEQSKMELHAQVLNINHGHNKQLLESCQSLSDYAAFVDRVKCHSKKMDFADGVNLAIDECIQEGILKDFLMTRREQVMSSMLSEYNEEEVLAMLSKEYYEEGKSDGIAEGKAAGKSEGLAEGKAVGKSEGLAEGKAAGKSEGLAEGKAVGKSEGLAESILLLLEEIGEVDDKLQQSILQENDEVILTKLLKLAAKAKTIDEFTRNSMQ